MDVIFASKYNSLILKLTIYQLNKVIRFGCICYFFLLSLKLKDKVFIIVNKSQLKIG